MPCPVNCHNKQWPIEGHLSICTCEKNCGRCFYTFDSAEELREHVEQRHVPSLKKAGFKLSVKPVKKSSSCSCKPAKSKKTHAQDDDAAIKAETARVYSELEKFVQGLEKKGMKDKDGKIAQLKNTLEDAAKTSATSSPTISVANGVADNLQHILDVVKGGNVLEMLELLQQPYMQRAMEVLSKK